MIFTLRMSSVLLAKLNPVFGELIDPYSKNCKNTFLRPSAHLIMVWILDDARELLLILLSVIMTYWLCKKMSIFLDIHTKASYDT